MSRGSQIIMGSNLPNDCTLALHELCEEDFALAEKWVDSEMIAQLRELRLMASEQVPMIVAENESKELVYLAAFYSNQFIDLKCDYQQLPGDISFEFYFDRRTSDNSGATCLLKSCCEYAFSEMGALRVIWQIHNLDTLLIELALASGMKMLSHNPFFSLFSAKKP